MDKLKMQTKNIADENYEKLIALFPDIITEIVDDNGDIVRAIDARKLTENINSMVVNKNESRYEFSWPNKYETITELNKPITSTLRPDRESSVNFDETNNIYIEGDNLEVLKLLRNTYLNKIRMIYIDPPYNTGNDFIYDDNYSMNSNDYNEANNYIDELGNRLYTNKESLGRFHTNWLNMIYPRLKISRDLLTNDGLIFISIDDNEYTNLKKICDEIYGQKNFIGNIVVNGTPKNDPLIVSTSHEYCLVYARNIDYIKENDIKFGIKNPYYHDLIKIYKSHKDNSSVEEELSKYYIKNDLDGTNISNYKYADKHGIYRLGPLDDPQHGNIRDVRMNPVTNKPCPTPNSGWRCTLDTWNEWVAQDLIYFPEKDVIPSKKIYITEEKLFVLRSVLNIQLKKDTSMLKKMFGLKINPFPNPKPVNLIKSFIECIQDKNAIILDFFGGSSTTAQACIEQNIEDGGNRKFIIVQIPQEIKVESGMSNRAKQIANAAITFLNENNLPVNICEIGKERIRRSTLYLKDKLPNLEKDIDYGFKVFKVDSSNMKDVYYTPERTIQYSIEDHIDNIKDNRTEEDLLYQVLLEFGIGLTAKVDIKSFDNINIYSVNNQELICCFDYDITEHVIEEIAKMKPDYLVIRNISSNNIMNNIYETIKIYRGKSTDLRIL